MALIARNQKVRVELELVYDQNAAKAQRARDATVAAIVAHNGRKLDQARIDPIAYDALLVEVTAAAAQAIAERNPASLAGLPDVYAIRPQSRIDVVSEPGDAVPAPIPPAAPTKPAIAAIVDGVPTANHPAFGQHVVLVDPDDLSALAVGVRTHGTAMTSLGRSQKDRASTVFHRAWEGIAPRRFGDGETFEIRVARKPDPFDDLPDTVDFSVVASLEASDEGLQIYEQIRERIELKPIVAVPVPIRPGA